MPTTRQRKPSPALRTTPERLTVEERLRIVTGRLALLAAMFETCSVSHDRLGTAYRRTGRILRTQRYGRRSHSMEGRPAEQWHPITIATLESRRIRVGKERADSAVRERSGREVTSHKRMAGIRAWVNAFIVVERECVETATEWDAHADINGLIRIDTASRPAADIAVHRVHLDAATYGQERLDHDMVSRRGAREHRQGELQRVSGLRIERDVQKGIGTGQANPAGHLPPRCELDAASHSFDAVDPGKDKAVYDVPSVTRGSIEAAVRSTR